MPSGMVKKWVADRGFGFITPDAGGGDVFMHIKALPRGVEPHEGARVTYDVAQDAQSGKMQATNVRII
ncbi:cold shock domain-containing protein (plasmid) [Bradyrhizobium sp. CB82]|uniref:cold-shock protein n=1 Tax=Bradyrhizobium sp. CB82 TaxID=3039159 RepID=UPI0024B2457E|nr:cold shock domain-containing protein [Bradyrhizobium sp. CB82]WFU45405.1 cold shock domain-containing protein [Bradyrhizobium sp. CB82]